MTRASFRFRDYTIRPDFRPDAEPITSAMQCAKCDESGPQTEESEDGTAWAARHLKANPEHLDYREHVIRPYRFEAGEWQ